VITATGGDPYIATRDLPPDARGPFTVNLRLSSTGSGGGVLYYAESRGQPFHRDRTVNFPMTHDGQPHNHRLTLPVDKVRALRLDPGNAPGTIVIEQFGVVDASGAKVALPALAP
jgi:hypothetical protein